MLQCQWSLCDGVKCIMNIRHAILILSDSWLDEGDAMGCCHAFRSPVSCVHKHCNGVSTVVINNISIGCEYKEVSCFIFVIQKCWKVFMVCVTLELIEALKCLPVNMELLLWEVAFCCCYVLNSGMHYALLPLCWYGDTHYFCMRQETWTLYEHVILKPCY